MGNLLSKISIIYGFLSGYIYLFVCGYLEFFWIPDYPTLFGAQAFYLNIANKLALEGVSEDKLAAISRIPAYNDIVVFCVICCITILIFFFTSEQSNEDSISRRAMRALIAVIVFISTATIAVYLFGPLFLFLIPIFLPLIVSSLISRSVYRRTIKIFERYESEERLDLVFILEVSSVFCRMLLVVMIFVVPSFGGTLFANYRNRTTFPRAYNEVLLNRTNDAEEPQAQRLQKDFLIWSDLGSQYWIRCERNEAHLYGTKGDARYFYLRTIYDPSVVIKFCQ